jgi:geranylgeranyl diphosphate synthase type 3
MSEESTKRVMHHFDETLLESYRYIQAIPGKNVRGKLIDCFNLWFEIEDKTIVGRVKEIVADLHNASLLVDDIEDRSTLRRGVPVAHSVFGIPVVINTANYIYFAALEKCHALDNPESLQVFVTELLNLHRGHGHDIQWREDFACPSEEDYLDMIRDKTGGLFRIAIGLLQPFCSKDKKQNFTKLVNDLSVYFQIRDDLMNLVDPELFQLKTFAEDLTEGKFSFPVIHSINTSEKGDKRDTRLVAILRQKTDEVYVKEYAIDIMRGTGSLQYTRETCQLYKEKTLKEIEHLGGNPPLVKLVEMLDVKLKELDANGSLSHSNNKKDSASHL